MHVGVITLLLLIISFGYIWKLHRLWLQQLHFLTFCKPCKPRPVSSQQPGGTASWSRNWFLNVAVLALRQPSLSYRYLKVNPIVTIVNQSHCDCSSCTSWLFVSLVNQGAQCIWVKAVNLVASYRRGICVPWGAFLEWRTAQQIGRCLESAVKSPCNFSGSVLPSGYLIACLISTVRLYVMCWKQICILLLLIVLAGLLKSRMRSIDCKVVQFSNRKCWEPHRFPCKSSFAICVSDIWRYGGKLVFHVLAQ